MSRKRRPLIILGVIAMSLCALGVAALLPASFGARATGERLERMRSSPQWGDGVFVNSIETRMDIEGGPLKGAWEWISNDQQTTPDVPIPVATPGDLAAVGDDRVRITWMGHSTMLIELDGHLVLTDPVWGPRASPYSFMGPARFHPPPLELEELGGSSRS